jgi:hypothetical protein
LGVLVKTTPKKASKEHGLWGMAPYFPLLPGGQNIKHQWPQQGAKTITIKNIYTQKWRPRAHPFCSCDFCSHSLPEYHFLWGNTKKCSLQ